MKLNKDIPFTVAPNALIQDENISPQGRFLYVYMASMPDDWDFYMNPLAKKMQMTVKTLRKYMDELEQCGWLTNHGQQNTNGAFGANEYTIHSTTVGQNLPHGKKGVTQKRRDAKKGTLTKETIIQKKQKEKKEEEISSPISFFETKQAITKHLNKAIKKKEWLELTDGLEKDVPTIIAEVADAWIGKDRPFNPKSISNQKGVITFAKAWCENLPRHSPKQTETKETIISKNSLGNNPDAIYEFIETTRNRKMPDGEKEYCRPIVENLLKKGVLRLDKFQDEYPEMIKHIPKAKNLTSLFEGYERFVTYIQ